MHMSARNCIISQKMSRMSKWQKSWAEVPTNGEFSNIMHNPLPQTVTFNKGVQARFIKLEATTPAATTAKVEMNEIGVTVAP